MCSPVKKKTSDFFPKNLIVPQKNRDVWWKRRNAKPNIKNLDQKERNIWEIAITSFKG